MVTAKITRYRLPDGQRPGPAWHWGYNVHVGGDRLNIGRGLNKALEVAARRADRIEEAWDGGGAWINTHRWVLVDADGNLCDRISYPTEQHARRVAEHGETPLQLRVLVNSSG